MSLLLTIHIWDVCKLAYKHSAAPLTVNEEATLLVLAVSSYILCKQIKYSAWCRRDIAGVNSFLAGMLYAHMLPIHYSPSESPPFLAFSRLMSCLQRNTLGMQPEALHV